MAQPEALSEGPKILQGLSPEEIVAMHREMRAWQSVEFSDSEESGEPRANISALKALKEQFDLDNPAAAITDAIEELAETDQPRLGAIATAFVQSPDLGDRVEAAVFLIDKVAKISPVTGHALWEQLLRDREPMVRTTAYNVLEAFVGAYSSNGSDALMEKTGLSGEQYDHLRAAYLHAEQGEDIITTWHNEIIVGLGNLAAGRVVKPSS